MVSVVLFVIGLNMKISGLRGCWCDKNAMWEKENGLPTVLCLFVYSKEKKAGKTRGNVRHVLYYSNL